jgi:radical SAM superfamily enzyme YgiQ (UPF0313 family)
MALRLALISPRGPLYRHKTGIWKKSLRYAPLTLTTLASLIPNDLEVDLTLIDEGIQEIDVGQEFDLVGISTITGTAPRAYELSNAFRQRGIPVVLGGVHPTLVPDEAQQHADSIVVGYAEETFPELLYDFVAGKLKRRYTQAPGLSLANRPRPKRELLPSSKHSVLHTIEATRGCIHTCDFCVVPAAWGRPLQRPINEVIDDIRQMNAKRLIFLDLNLIADGDYAKELFKAMTSLKLTWGGLATTLIARDDELLRLAHDSGCRGLLIGFESLSAASLKETHKSFNARQDYKTVMQKLHDHSIAVMGCFVFGFDHDDETTFAETVDFVYDTNIDLPRYAILTPFPGTALYKRLEREGRILTKDWTLYDGQHVVYHPKLLSADELAKQTQWAWKQTYRFGSIGKRLLGSRIQLPVSLAANLGYRYYAHNLHRFYTCDWSLLRPVQEAVA